MSNNVRIQIHRVELNSIKIIYRIYFNNNQNKIVKSQNTNLYIYIK